MRDLSSIKKPFEYLSRIEDRRKIFDMTLDLMLQGFNHWDPERQEKINKIYNSFHAEDIPQIEAAFRDMIIAICEVSDNNGKGLYDALGIFYMLEVSTNNLGQFFTPPEISDLMAGIVLPEMSEKDTSIIKTFADPCCGSGGLLLSAAKKSRNNIFYGADIDYTCAKMCAINLLMNGLWGEVAHMDSLSMKYYGSFIIGRHSESGFPAYIWNTDQQKSAFFDGTKDKAA